MTRQPRQPIPRGMTEVERGALYGRDLRAYHERCALCHLPQDTTAVEPSGATVRLCCACKAIGPCDDCGRWVGHQLSVEH